MGSWNKTCVLSNLAIYDGDKVVVFILEDGGDGSDSYATALFRPLLLPFNSVYNDYGDGEKSFGIGFDLIMKALSSQVVGWESGKIMTEKDFFSFVRDGKCEISSLSRRKRKVNFCMIREDVLKSIFNGWELSEYIGDGEYKKFKYADILNYIPEWIEVIDSYIRETIKTSGPRYKSVWEEIKDDEGKIFECLGIHWDFDSMRHFRNEENDSYIFDFLGWNRYHFSSIVGVELEIMRLVFEKRYFDAKVLLAEHIKAVYINTFFEATRKVWIPGYHEGSQNDNGDEYLVLTSAIESVIKEERRRSEEDDW